VALDARVVLHGPGIPQGSLPKLAIRPYPAQYMSSWTLPDGAPVTIRPIRPEDEPLLAAFHETLSEESVYLRYLQVLKLCRRVAHERLAQLCFIDYDRSMALVADRTDPTTGDHRVVAVGRLITDPGTREAEFALVVSDPFQGQGLGTEILRRLLQVGRQENLRCIRGQIHPENGPMLHACEKLGFRLIEDTQKRLVMASTQDDWKKADATGIYASEFVGGGAL
jgi:acetyltransferase